MFCIQMSIKERKRKKEKKKKDFQDFPGSRVLQIVMTKDIIQYIMPRMLKKDVANGRKLLNLITKNFDEIQTRSLFQSEWVQSQYQPAYEGHSSLA